MLTVHRRAPFDRLELDDHFVLDEQIDAELEADGHLLFHVPAAFLERASQHGFIDRFQQPGPEMAMELNRGVDDAFGNVV